MVSPWAINHSPHIWGADADEFKPERWLGEGNNNSQTGGQSSNYAQITFLHGHRSCIGQGFAKAELKCLAAALFGRFEVAMADPAAKVYRTGIITVKPTDAAGNHARMRLKKIDGW
jgi:cytochrome P450